MIKLDEKKLAGLKTGSQHLAETYGPVGSPSREEFEAKAKAWYYAELLRDERKRQKLSQLQLAGLANTGIRFVSDVENGKGTVQLQKLLAVISALGLCMFVYSPWSES